LARFVEGLNQRFRLFPLMRDLYRRCRGITDTNCKVLAAMQPTGVVPPPPLPRSRVDIVSRAASSRYDNDNSFCLRRKQFYLSSTICPETDFDQYISTGKWERRKKRSRCGGAKEKTRRLGLISACAHAHAHVALI